MNRNYFPLLGTLVLLYSGYVLIVKFISTNNVDKNVEYTVCISNKHCIHTVHNVEYTEYTVL